MIRAILAAALGYLALSVWIIGTSVLAWAGLGAEFAFREGTTDPTLGWMMVNLTLGLAGAIGGGYVASRIGGDFAVKPVRILAGIVLILGVIMAGAPLLRDEPADPQITKIEGKLYTEDGRAVGDLNAFEAASVAIRPAGYAFLLPVVGFGGVLLGGRRRGPGGEQNQA